MARKKSSRKAAGSTEETSLTPMQALTDKECFEAVISSFGDLAKANQGIFSSKKAYSAIREKLGSKVPDMDLNWIRTFVRLLEKKDVLRRQASEGASKSFMLKLGDTTFRASRRVRRVRRNTEAPRSPNVVATGSDENCTSTTIIPMIDQKIANLEAELAKLKQARELLS